MSDRFVFYSHSADKLPGQGTGEHIESDDDYSDLKVIKNWRKILSNFYECEFIYDNQRFNSAEHAFHYAKLQTINQPEKANLFCLSEESEKTSPQQAKKLGGKKGVYQMNSDEQTIWAVNREQCLTDILTAKFSQCPKAKQVLLATKFAELWHQIQRGPKEHWIFLENIRTNLTD